MCICEFCGTSFFPRPQTKNPRACKDVQCQKTRQRQNEKEWHEQNQNLYRKNNKYHQQQRIVRYTSIQEIINSLLDSLMAGIRFKGLSFDLDKFKNSFSNFMHRSGIRQINKFWKSSEPPASINLLVKA